VYQTRLVLGHQAPTMIVDLPAANFSQSSDIGELIGTDLAAGQARLFMFKFHDCWVEMDKLFPVAAGLRTCKALFRTYADHKYADCYSPQFVARLQAHAAADYDGVFVLGGVDNYWHFLVDHLAKLPLLHHFGGAAPTIVASARITDGFAQLIERACSFMGLAPPALVKETRPILRCARSFVPCVNDAAPRLRFLRDLGLHLQAADASPAPERIFFRRGNVSQRKVLNESEVERKLIDEFDFVAVDSGAMTVMEQINLVKNAKIIVGGHGAALTNLIFAGRLDHMVELYVWHTQTFLKAACGHLGVGHHFLRGDPVGKEPAGDYARWDNQDYTVPVEQLIKLIDAITGRPR
jgi:capsular polysaccharide biosynthesis protein